MASTAFKKVASFITEIVAQLTTEKPEYPKHQELVYPLRSSDGRRHELVVSGTANRGGSWSIYTQKVDETKPQGSMSYRELTDYAGNVKTTKAIEVAKEVFVREGDVMEHWEDFSSRICLPLSKTIKRASRQPEIGLSIV